MGPKIGKNEKSANKNKDQGKRKSITGSKAKILIVSKEE